MAQLVAHLHGMQRVRGSSPLSSTHHCRSDGVSGPVCCHLWLSRRASCPNVPETLVRRLLLRGAGGEEAAGA